MINKKIFKFWTYYSNDFNKELKDKRLFKCIDYKISLLKLTILNIHIRYRSNLRTTKDYNSNKECKYYFDAFYLTLFSNKYNIIEVNISYYNVGKKIKFFNKIYSK